MGLCKPADFDESQSIKNSIYGVLPYIAPEVLRGQNYTKAADIYSFGIIICLDANPLNRPNAEEIRRILDKWVNQPESDLENQIKEAEEFNYNFSTGLIPSNCRIPPTNLGLSYKTHSEAIYTSRLLSFNNLPEPINSDDYYKQHDNIISEEFSESLQIDVPQLNISDYSEKKI
ncbi:unnamed protein product [Rhizophagus irregularis]|nr:unnamed protein product [Rhizophagus irregularis]